MKKTKLALLPNINRSEVAKLLNYNGLPANGSVGDHTTTHILDMIYEYNQTALQFNELDFQGTYIVKAIVDRLLKILKELNKNKIYTNYEFDKLTNTPACEGYIKWVN